MGGPGSSRHNPSHVLRYSHCMRNKTGFWTKSSFVFGFKCPWSLTVCQQERSYTVSCHHPPEQGRLSQLSECAQHTSGSYSPVEGLIFAVQADPPGVFLAEGCDREMEPAASGSLCLWLGHSRSEVLVNDQEDLSLVPKTHVRRAGVAAHICNPSPGEQSQEDQTSNFQVL